MILLLNLKIEITVTATSYFLFAEIRTFNLHQQQPLHSRLIFNIYKKHCIFVFRNRLLLENSLHQSSSLHHRTSLEKSFQKLVNNIRGRSWWWLLPPARGQHTCPCSEDSSKLLNPYHSKCVKSPPTSLKMWFISSEAAVLCKINVTYFFHLLIWYTIIEIKWRKNKQI